jgi:hypothetical protein
MLEDSILKHAGLIYHISIYAHEFFMVIIRHMAVVGLAICAVFLDLKTCRPNTRHFQLT